MFQCLTGQPLEIETVEHRHTQPGQGKLMEWRLHAFNTGRQYIITSVSPENRHISLFQPLGNRRV